MGVLLKFDSLLRWWSILTAAVAGFSMSQIVVELDAIGFAQQKSSECGLPIFSKGFLRHIESFGVYGSIFAVLIIAAALIGFRLCSSEEARYRLVTVINVVAWPILFLGFAAFFLAAYALPYAKCAAAA